MEGLTLFKGTAVDQEIILSNRFCVLWEINHVFQYVT